MAHNLANAARRILIRLGKSLPFVLCFVIFIGYVESILAIMTGDLLVYGEYITLNTRLSFAIAYYFKYDVLVVAISTILAFAVETCKWNRYAVCYTLIQLCERYYFDFELEPWAIYTICLVNIVVAGYLTAKGIKILLR